MGNFMKDIDTGEIGELATFRYLNTLSIIKAVQDVRNIKAYQELDVDYVAVTQKNRLILVEVKSDRLAHRTGNIAYEVYSSKNLKTKGCLEKTKAHRIFYYLIATDELYSINTKALREYVHKNFSEKDLRNMGDAALGYLIKIKDLVANRIAIKVNHKHYYISS